METKDLNSRFAYHKPGSESVAGKHEHVRAMALTLAQAIDSICPDSREKSLAITKIEEAMFWANAAIARHQGAALGGPGANYTGG